MYASNSVLLVLYWRWCYSFWMGKVCPFAIFTVDIVWACCSSDWTGMRIKFIAANVCSFKKFHMRIYVYQLVMLRHSHTTCMMSMTSTDLLTVYISGLANGAFNSHDMCHKHIIIFIIWLHCGCVYAVLYTVHRRVCILPLFQFSCHDTIGGGMMTITISREESL